MTQILTKQQNFRLWQAGEFGNKLRAWRTIDEWRASDYYGRVALRTLLPSGGGGPCLYDVAPAAVELIAGLWIDRGVARAWIMVNEMAPRAEILQGEYLNDIVVVDGEVRWGFFFYSRAQAPMRDALKQAPENAHSLRADLLIQNAMTPGSFADWCEVRDRHPGHVLEVSIYDHCLGDTPGRNALIWEIRRY